MSQVRKLKNGNKGIPKTYNIVLDNQTYTINDDQLTRINNELAELDPRYRMYLGGISNSIQSGDFVGSRTENTVSTSALTGLNDKELDFLRKKKATTWEAITDSNTYRAKEAINEALRIVSRVVNTPKKETEPEEESVSKKSIKKSNIDLDFNEKDGKKYLSPTGNYDAKKRVSDIIAHLQAGDNSEYDYSEYNTDAISSWLNGLEGDDKYKAGSDYFDNLWTSMGSGKYKYNPDDEDLLKLFGINYNLTAPVAPKSGVVTGKDGKEYKVGDTFKEGDKTYKITNIDNDGRPSVEEITDNKEELTSEETEQTAEQVTASSPQLVLIRPGDREDMDWGVYYNGVPYAYESIQPGSELGNLMAKFEKNNRQMWSQGKRYNENSFIKMPSIKNFADWTVGQTLDDGTDLNQFFLNQGITSAALNHIATDAEGNRYFKYYNNFDPSGTYIPREGNAPKQTPWGIRSPYYLMIDKDGNVTALSSEPTDAEYGIENIVDNAPKFKTIFNPSTSAWSRIEPRLPYDNTYFKTSSQRIPASFITEFVIDGKTYKVYNATKGRLYVDGPKGEDMYVTPHGLYEWMQRLNRKESHKQGGTISKSKIEAFKQGRIIKGKDGANFINVIQKDPTSKRRVERKSDGTVLIIERTTDEKGNIYETQTTLENPIPPDIAATVKRPLPSSTPLTKEEYSKVFPANTENQQKVVPNTPEETVTFIPNAFDIQHDSSSITVPHTPLAEQDVVKVKTNDVRNFGDLVDVLKQLIKRHKSGGIIKAQWGLDTDKLLKWKVPGWEITDQTPDWKQGSLYPEGMTPGIGYTTVVPGVLGMSDVDVTNGFSTIDMITGKEYPKQTVKQNTDTAGGMDKILPDYTKYLLPAISLARFGINSYLQRKYRDTSKKAIEAARFNESPVVLNTPRNDNPALDRALQQVQSERMAGVKPVTSDVIANNAIQNQREAQLYDREQDLVYQRSKADWEAKKEALNIMNQNIANQITTTNQNRARNASINSALYNPELEYIQRRGQSIENLGLEIQNNIKQDRNTMLNYAKQKEVERQTEILNRNLDSIFPGARAEYNALPFSEKSKYADLEEYLRTKYADTWSDNVEQIEKWRKDSANNMQRWLYLNGLNYSYPSFLTGKTPNIYKKGGYLRGKTRYTKEPDEQIWIDNNKATHAQIAKLTDATIKLLLRALK